MAPDEDRLNERLADLRRRRDEAEAVAADARDQLVGEAAGTSSLDDQDADDILAMAVDYADKLARYEELKGEYDRWRKVL